MILYKFEETLPMQTIILLIISNSFMTYAWYGHLRNPNLKLWQAILISWSIAFFEYCFMVPANRIGYRTFSAYQLKIMQEVITLSVFVAFAYFFLGEKFKWNYAVSFLCILGAVFFMFRE
jgi:uncharacterized protein (DUF486 family)